MHQSLKLCLWILFFIPILGHAKKFQNAYVSFDLPPNWNCQLEGTEWVCISRFADKSKEAIIILTAKQVGPSDSLEAYEAHLRTARSLPNPKGPPSQSKVIHVQNRRIANHPWIDGMHMGSEVPSYYTRYLGTVKESIAILVTFSAHKTSYTKYSNDFLKAIESLRVIASKDLLSNRQAVGIRPGNETIGSPIGAHIPGFDGDQLPPEPTSSGSRSLASYLLFLAFILGAVGVYLYLKSSKKSGSGKKRR